MLPNSQPKKNSKANQKEYHPNSQAHGLVTSGHSNQKNQTEANLDQFFEGSIPRKQVCISQQNQPQYNLLDQDQKQYAQQFQPYHHQPQESTSHGYASIQPNEYIDPSYEYQQYFENYKTEIDEATPMQQQEEETEYLYFPEQPQKKTPPKQQQEENKILEPDHKCTNLSIEIPSLNESDFTSLIDMQSPVIQENDEPDLEEILEENRQRIRALYSDSETENKKNFSGILREYCANQVRDILGGVKQYTTLYNQNKNNEDAKVDDLLPVGLPQHQLYKNLKEITSYERIRLQPIYDYLLSLSPEEYKQIDKQLLQAKFDHDKGNCWHSKKGWHQTCQWMKAGGKIAEQLYLMMFKGIMQDEQAFLLFKYHYICNSDRKSSRLIKYMMGEQISKDYDNLILKNM